MKGNPIRENVIQLGGLAAALALGYLIHGWSGAVGGFLLFAVLILFIVRHKMARAQEIGKVRRAARLASASPWSNTPDDLTSGNDNTVNGS